MNNHIYGVAHCPNNGERVEPAVFYEQFIKVEHYLQIALPSMSVFTAVIVEVEEPPDLCERVNVCCKCWPLALNTKFDRKSATNLLIGAHTTKL